MIIPYNNNFTKPYHAIVCESNDCKFKRECANHTSAGDFRSEDGFSPILTLQRGNVKCDTYHSPSNPNIHYATLPVEYDKLDRGLVCWENIHEMVDNYHI